MANWVILTDVTLGAQAPGAAAIHFSAGDIINDVTQPTAPLVAAGAILWPATDPVMAAAQVQSKIQKLRGNSKALLGLILAGALYALAGGSQSSLLGPAALPGAPAVGAIQKRTLTVTFASFAAIAAETATLNIGALLPANARIIAREVRIATEFTGGSVGSCTMSVGIAGATTLIVNAQDVQGVSGNVPGTAGTDPQALLAAASQLIATFTGTVANLQNLTAGSLTVDVLFTVLP